VNWITFGSVDFAAHQKRGADVRSLAVVGARSREVRFAPGSRIQSLESASQTGIDRSLAQRQERCPQGPGSHPIEALHFEHETA